MGKVGVREFSISPDFSFFCLNLSFNSPTQHSPPSVIDVTNGSNFIICGGINGEGGMFSTLRRLSTVSRRPRSKKKMLDFDKDIEMFSDKESGDGNTSGYVRWEHK